MRTPLLIVTVPLFVFFVGVAGTHKLDRWTVAASTAAAAGMFLVMWVRDDAPQHVLNGQRGAEGERRTERALRKLEREGWRVEHDIQRDGRANVDHVVHGPHRVFRLETKNLAGTIRVTDGVVEAQQFDDPDEVFRYFSLASRVRGASAELSARLREETGRRAWVDGVVAIWGRFEQEIVEHEHVAYVAGSRLADWLHQRDAAAAVSARRA
jgi:hypothetical protein